jgi:hypothetical protein
MINEAALGAARGGVSRVEVRRVSDAAGPAERSERVPTCAPAAPPYNGP